MAMGGLRPVVAVYSTFFSRAFDQANLDVGLHGCPVVFVLDRAGITGDDGPSHHGVLDLALACPSPGMTVFAPSSAEEVEPMLRDGPDPRRARRPSASPRPRRATSTPGDVGSGLQRAASCAPVTGRSASSAWARWSRPASHAADELAEGDRRHRVGRPGGLAARRRDAGRRRRATRWWSPSRTASATAGPAPSSSMPWPPRRHRQGARMPATRVLGVPRQFLAQGKADDILASLGLDGAGIAESVRRVAAARESPTEPATDRSPGIPLRCARPVRAVLAHEVVHRVVRIDRLAGVAPEALLHVVGHLPLPT